VAAQLLISWSRPGRVRSEAAFASPNPKSHYWKPAATKAPDTASTASLTGRGEIVDASAQLAESAAAQRRQESGSSSAPGNSFRSQPRATS
jgi:hypothetical protein